MSSTGYEKWKKYFSEKQQCVNTKPGKVVIYDDQYKVHNTCNESISITVLPVTEYNSKYKVKFSNNFIGYISEKNISKPILSCENLEIQTIRLVKTGEIQTIKYMGSNTQVYMFANSQELKYTVLSNINTYSNIISSSIFTVFSNTHFSWPNISSNEKNQIGKYVGEILYPYWQGYGKDVPIAFPTDSSFTCIDSIVCGKRPAYISNKYGQGAAGSLFSILPKLSLTSNSVLSKLYSANLTPREMIYSYCNSHIFSSNNLYVSCQSNNAPEKWKNFIYNSTLNEKILENFPYSSTRFIAEQIVSDIMKCSNSISQLNEFCNFRNHLQVNLHKEKWIYGRTDFHVKLFSDKYVKLVTNKSSYSDIRCNNGLINYRLYDKETDETCY